MAQDLPVLSEVPALVLLELTRENGGASVVQKEDTIWTSKQSGKTRPRRPFDENYPNLYNSSDGQFALRYNRLKVLIPTSVRPLSAVDEAGTLFQSEENSSHSSLHRIHTPR